VDPVNTIHARVILRPKNKFAESYFVRFFPRRKDRFLSENALPNELMILAGPALMRGNLVQPQPSPAQF
jgi:hypothetical protein